MTNEAKQGTLMPWGSALISRLPLRGAMDGWAVLWTLGGALILGHRLDRLIHRRQPLPPWYRPPWYRRDMGAWAGLVVGALLVLVGWP